MVIHAALEYNEAGCLVFAVDYPGAFARGKTRDEALDKLPEEVRRWRCWARDALQGAQLSADAAAKDVCTVQLVQSVYTAACVADADSAILLDNEKGPLTPQRYRWLKTLALRSAADFDALYRSIPAPDETDIPQRPTFYSALPRTARQMYIHVNDVTAAYLDGLAEIKNLPDIYQNRLQAFARLEAAPDYLQNNVYTHFWAEEWSLAKTLRRFIWHDRIHARAMWRMATRVFKTDIADPFYFDA